MKKSIVMNKRIEPFSQPIIEELCKIIGNSERGLTGTQISNLLVQAHMIDVSPSLSKWKRLYNSFVDFQNRNHCANNILNFVKLVLSPSRYVNQEERFEWLLNNTNQQLAFVGFKVKEDGSLIKKEKVSTISEAQIKANNLKQEIEKRDCHIALLDYCKAELLENNYFHAVFEACKGLFERIRELSEIQKDGNNLVEEVFSSNPILVINNYTTKSEIDEHKGFCNILKGICGMFRNPESHEPKISWELTRQDALEILGMISYCHRRLDNARKNR